MQLIDFVAIALAVGLAVLGIFRGLWKEIMVTLAGIVLGIVLVTFWGEPGAWGVTTLDSTRLGFIHLGGLLLVVLFIGYGSALFLPRRPLLWWQRLAGAGIGLANGALLAALSFRYIQDYFVIQDSVLKSSLFYAIAGRWLPWAFLAAAGAVSLTVLIVALVRFGRFIVHMAQPPEVGEIGLAAPPAAAPGATPAPGPAPVAPPEALAAEPTVPCPNCGQPMPVGATFCPHCGKVIS
jgi:hypothetical protein